MNKLSGVIDGWQIKENVLGNLVVGIVLAYGESYLRVRYGERGRDLFTP